MHKHFSLLLLLAGATLLSSCQKDSDVPQVDYAIESTRTFELISQHPNGWIKKGRNSLGENQLREEFEYYESGYIKSAKVYASYPKQHLYMEVSRSENNKPLWSKYYNPDGGLWFETEYANGLPLVKKVYSDEGTAIHSYTNGELSQVTFTAADNSNTSTTTYNAASESRNVTITSNGQTILDENYPYQEQAGAGIYTNNYVPVANPFGTTETSYYKLNQSSSSSPTWQNDADPIEFMFPYRLFDEFYYPGNYFAAKFTVCTDLYQSVIEQYPVTEKGVLISGAKYQDGFRYFENKWGVRDSLRKVYDNNPSLYELKYGNEFVEKVGYGRLLFVIGAIRNLPTNPDVADKIKSIALKRMKELQGGSTSLTTEEQEMLSKVWFEVKFFSTLKEHLNGVVINSSEDYNQALQELNDADLSVLQLKYDSAKNL